MRNIILIGIIGIAIVGVAALFYDHRPDDQGMSRADKEAAANNPLLRTENNTQGNETMSVNVAESSGGPDLDVTARGDEVGTAEIDLLTVEGYDADRVRQMMLDIDMPVETRNTYLRRLQLSLGDDERLAQILTELRADVGASVVAFPPVASAQDMLPRNDTQARQVEQGITEIDAILEAHDSSTAVVNDETALDAPRIDRADATRPSFIVQTLEPDAFEAERVVALIQAAPRLTDGEKAHLQTAVHTLIEVPKARKDVLDRLETLLLTLS